MFPDFFANICRGQIQTYILNLTHSIFCICRYRIRFLQTIKTGIDYVKLLLYDYARLLS